MKVREKIDKETNCWGKIVLTSGIRYSFGRKKALNKLNGVKRDMNFLYHTTKGSSYN